MQARYSIDASARSLNILDVSSCMRARRRPAQTIRVVIRHLFSTVTYTREKVIAHCEIIAGLLLVFVNRVSRNDSQLPENHLDVNIARVYGQLTLKCIYYLAFVFQQLCGK